MLPETTAYIQSRLAFSAVYFIRRKIATPVPLHHVTTYVIGFLAEFVSDVVQIRPAGQPMCVTRA
jgi:hypothetical protein